MAMTPVPNGESPVADPVVAVDAAPAGLPDAVVGARGASILEPKLIKVRTRTAYLSEAIAATTAHCTVVAADIEGFGKRSRNNTNQVRIRDGMYRALEDAFGTAEIPWARCRRDDRGDGVLILAPAEIPKALFVDYLPDALVDALADHNRNHRIEERIRLKLALHAGEINYDDYGVTGSAINHTFRILDADSVKTAFAQSAAVLAVIGSAWFFDEVIRHSEWSRSRSYRSIDVVNKETKTQAWIRLLKTTVATLRKRVSSDK
jgi:hypothetical protein